MSYKPSMSEIKNLRERSGAGIQDCKNALVESQGDIEGAFDWLRMRGIAKAAKKASRVAAEGTIYAKVDGNVGVLLEINCETDFAAGTDDFKGFVSEAADIVLSQAPSTMDELMSCTWSNGMNTEEYKQQIVFKTGENIQIRRFERYVASEGAHVHFYLHGNRLGSLVEVQAPAGDGTENVLDEICMHIVASRPQFVATKDIPAEMLDKETDIQMERASQDDSLAGKPENVVKGIIAGRVKKWSQDIALNDQEWYEEKMKTADKLKQFGGDLGGAVSVTRFAVFGLGEGIEKKETNFAEEVASMSQQS